MKHENLKYEQVELDREQWSYSVMFSAEMADMIKNNGNEIRVSELRQSLSHDMFIQNISTHIAKQQLGEMRASFPANWKESLKDAFLPKWLKKRYPVRMTSIKLEAKALYPRISLPRERHAVILVKTQDDYLEPDED